MQVCSVSRQLAVSFELAFQGNVPIELLPPVGGLRTAVNIRIHIRGIACADSWPPFAP